MNASSTSALARPCVVIATALLILALNLSFGAAVVTAAADDDIPGSAFVLGSTVGGTVDPSTDPSDVYCIHLNAGDEIRIECMPTATSSDANPKKGHLSFLAPGVPSLAGSKDFVIASYRNLWKGNFLTSYAEFEYVAPRSDTYYIRVEAAEGSFAYDLGVEYTGGPAYPTADANDIPGLPQGLGSVRGVVDTRVDRNDVYAVKLFSGQPVALSLEPTHTTDTKDYHLTGTARLSLLAPSSTSVGSYSTFSRACPEVAAFNSSSNDRDETAVITYTPTSTGVYYILIQASSVVTNFAYTLAVTGTAEVPDTAPPADQTFPDVNTGHPYFTAIEGMADAGIISGYNDGTFGPYNPVLRAQFAKMICGTLAIPVDESLVAPFSDLLPDDPATLYPHDYIAAAYLHGITQGITATDFGPYVDITRAQVITMVVRAARNLQGGVLVEPPPEFDCTIPDFSSTHHPQLRTAEYNGLLAGIQSFERGWDPWARSSRGECAQILWNLITRMAAE